MFHRPHIYTVHIKPDEPIGRTQPVFVKEGFNIIAFLLTALWAFFERLWLVGVVLLACNIAIMTFMEQGLLSELSMWAINIGFHFFVGLQANDWIRARLQRQGYVMTDVAVGENRLRAEMRFFDRYMANKSA